MGLRIESLPSSPTSLLPPDCDLFIPAVRPFVNPSIVFVNPASLLPHELVSTTHLKNLLSLLSSLHSNSNHVLPLPVVTQSLPRVILDGHHRIQAFVSLNFHEIPCWEILDPQYDDGNDEDDYDNLGDNALLDSSSDFPPSYHSFDPSTPSPSSMNSRLLLEGGSRLLLEGGILVYDRGGKRIPLSRILKGARNGSLSFGVKGTRHVVLCSLKAPCPRIDYLNDLTGEISKTLVERSLEEMSPKWSWSQFSSRRSPS